MLSSEVPHAQREERQKADVIFEIILCDEISNISQQENCFLPEPGLRPSPPSLWCSSEGSGVIGGSGKCRWLQGLCRASQVRLNEFRAWLICSSKGQHMEEG